MSGSPEEARTSLYGALRPSFLCMTSLVLWLIVLSGSCRADGGRVAIAAQGTDGFGISATNLTDVMSLDISIEYSDATMANPSVSTTAVFMGETVRKNTDSPGKISISGTVRKNFRERITGSLAVVRFEQSGDGPGKIYSAQVVATGTGGGRQDVPVSIGNPSEQSNKEKKDKQEDVRADGDDGGPGSDGNGTVPDPAVNDGSSFQRRGYIAASPVGSTSAARIHRPGRSPRHDQPVEFQRREGVLDRFREIKSFRDTEALVKIFRDVRSGEFRQIPSVILSDGRTRANISLHVNGAADDGPFFMLKNARCLSVRNPGVNSWELEVLPDPGVYEASVTVRYGSKIIEYPLTVAPYLESRTEDAEKTAPVTYIDHFIRIANRLAAQK